MTDKPNDRDGQRSQRSYEPETDAASTAADHRVVVEVEPEPTATRSADAPEGDDRPVLSQATAAKLVEQGGRAAIPNDPMNDAADRQPQSPSGTSAGAVNADGEPDSAEKAAERLAFHGVQGKA